MIFPLFSHDFLMIFPWFSHDFLMIFSWFSHDFPWFSHYFPMIFRWFSHDFPMIFPWSSHISGFSRHLWHRHPPSHGVKPASQGLRGPGDHLVGQQGSTGTLHWKAGRWGNGARSWTSDTKTSAGIITTMWGPRSIAKLVYNSNNYGLWYL